MATTTFITQLINTALAPPTNILTGGFLTATLLIAYDVETGVSFKLPGNRRIGGAALIAVSAAAYYYVQRFGLQVFFDKFAEFLIFGVLLGAIGAYVLRRGN